MFYSRVKLWNSIPVSLRNLSYTKCIIAKQSLIENYKSHDQYLKLVFSKLKTLFKLLIILQLLNLVSLVMI